MKKTLLSLLALFIASFISAQTVNKVPLDSIDSKYIVLYVSSAPGVGTSALHVGLDYGQARKGFKNTHFIQNNEGKFMQFTSLIQATNLLNTFGYEVVTGYQVSDDESTSIHYLMKKKE